MSNLIRSAALLGFPELVRELGADPMPFLVRFHIEPGIERQPDTFASFDPVVRLLQATAEELDCPDLGLRLANWQGLDVLGPIAVIARNSRTVQGGLEAIARFFYVHSPALSLSVAPRTPPAAVRFRYEIDEPIGADARQAYEVSMANGARIVQLLGGPDSRPSLISFKHDQMGPDEAYRAALGCPVQFGQTWCGFELSASLADRPIDSADPETRRIAAKYLEAHYVPRTAGLSERVTELIRRLLPTGHCTADAIADHLAMHPRALQRRLADEGVRCADLIDRERRNLAAKYLADPRLHLSQVVGLLGYTEQSSLNRSVRRWFGKTPSQYRAALHSGWD